MADKDDRSGIDAYVMLLDRMRKVVDALSPHQRDYHVVLRVDIYWYIQKQKEVEILAARLLQDDNVILKRYLDSLCDDISTRIDADEAFAREYAGSAVAKGPIGKSYGTNQGKLPRHPAGNAGR